MAVVLKQCVGDSDAKLANSVRDIQSERGRRAQTFSQGENILLEVEAKGLCVAIWF